jgi:chromosome segregation protein
LAADHIATIEHELDATRTQLSKAEHVAAVAQLQEHGSTTQLARLDQRLATLQTAATEKQILAAKCEQRVEMLRSQLEQAQRDQQERDQALDETRRRLADRESQLADLDASMLTARQTLAELFVRQQQHALEFAQLAAADEQLRQARNELVARIRHDRQQLNGLQAQQHKLEIATNRLRHERQTLAERMQDDYGIDLAAAASEPAGEPASAGGNLGPRDSVEREIAELRDQINQIGAVNLDSLAELDELETRFGGLAQQYRDLVDAKASLERIIQRINVDSRQLFLDTLEIVRGHFRELFRRLFGGGEADILLDEAEDVLECGIDIVACPPGKEACSISLLSGGEKTLTCVALLLAVFRSKPSPFCVLDEVDAALDESNIGRFIQVLREFLSFTQFVVVSHSKKTMAGADTLYGVTMEESGVSKHVSVRFEDVSEDGQILPGGPRRDQPAPAAAGGDDSSANRRAA